MKRVRRARLEDRSWGAVGALDAASSPIAPALVDAADSAAAEAAAAVAGDDDATATSGGLLVDDPRVLHAFRCGRSDQSGSEQSGSPCEQWPE